MNLRNLAETDYKNVISVIDEWWGGRHVSDKLPKLFFQHFKDTSFIIEEDNLIVAFLVGFVSQSYPTEAYIHFIGVHPDYRKKGIASKLYFIFFELVKNRGCQTVKSITSPVNKDSIGFHTRIGFEIENADEAEEISANAKNDESDLVRVRFVRKL